MQLVLSTSKIKMAASMFSRAYRGHGMLLQQLCRRGRISLGRTYTSTSYYVLLPEVPPDTADTNPVMRYKQLPEFAKITPENIIRGAAKRVIEYEVALSDHLQQLEDVQFPKTFESVFHPLEELTPALNYVWRTARQLSYVADEGFKYAYGRVDMQIAGAKMERWNSEVLLRAIKEVKANCDNLTEAQQRLCGLYLYEYKMCGMLLSLKEKRELYDIKRRNNDDRNEFSLKVMLCQDLFEHEISDYSIVDDLPRSLLYHMAVDKSNWKDGPWKVRLFEPIYSDFLAHCNDPTSRWNAWYAKVNVSSHNHADQYINNNVLIQDIRARRNRMAKTIGYKNFAEMTVDATMAKTLENVIDFLETVKTVVHSKAEEELASLQEIADANTFRKSEIEIYDIPYWKAQKEKEMIGLNVDGISEYFPAPTVMEGLFSLCTKLFGIHFKENKTCEIWHEDVIVYDILDKDGTYISTFYIDPYAREDKKIDTWMEAGAPNSGFIGTRPFSYLGLNLIPPSSPSEPAFMTYADVKDLFQKFGHGLQQMLTTVPYNEISGQFGIEWDAGFVCGKFFQKWVTRPEILTSISGHHITGQPLSQELASKVIKGAGLLDAYNMCYELFLSAFAIEIHVLPWNEHWHKVFSRTWANYMPIPLHKDDYSPNSMMFIFYDSLGANYYSLLWSEMLAADIFAAFEEAGFENDEKQAVVGKRYRDTYLSLGGSVSPTEVFRRFRGRDPSIQPMLTKFS